MEQFKVVPDESIFFDLTPEEVTLLFVILGLAIERLLTLDELDVLANGLFTTAQVLFIIGAQRSLINDLIESQQKKQDDEKSADKMDAEIKKLQTQIENLQKEINALKK